MGIPFQHTRTKLRHQITNIKGHIGNGYESMSRKLGNIDHTIQTLRAIHKVATPMMGGDNTFNKNVVNLGMAYDAYRAKALAANQVVRTAVAVGGALHKRGMGIGM